MFIAVGDNGLTLDLDEVVAVESYDEWGSMPTLTIHLTNGTKVVAEFAPDVETLTFLQEPLPQRPSGRLGRRRRREYMDAWTAVSGANYARRRRAQFDAASRMRDEFLVMLRATPGD